MTPRPSCFTIDIPLPPREPSPWERTAPPSLQERLKAKREGTPLPESVSGDVPTTPFLEKVMGKGTVSRWHHMSRPSFHAVTRTRYVPHIPTEAEVAKNWEWSLKTHPENLSFYLAGAQKAAAESVHSTSLLFQTLHDAYDRHLPVSLAPEVLWYAVCHEVAIAVKAAPDTYAHLYTTTPGEKQQIVVQVNHYTYAGPNDWAEGIQQFEGELRARVPDGIMDHALPRFSTSTQESDVATLVAFMDAASPYYEYGMCTSCGIPRIRLEGTPADWALLLQKASAFSEVFAPSLKLYFEHLLPVLATLSKAAHGDDVGMNFWKSMVKVDGGSGGPYVSGWLCTFWNYTPDNKGGYVPKDKSLYEWSKGGGMFHGMNPSDFTSHVSKVPFEWEYYGEKYPMNLVSGVLGVELDGEFLCPRLGFAVAELAPSTTRLSEETP